MSTNARANNKNNNGSKTPKEIMTKAQSKAEKRRLPASEDAGVKAASTKKKRGELPEVLEEEPEPDADASGAEMESDPEGEEEVENGDESALTSRKKTMNSSPAQLPALSENALA